MNKQQMFHRFDDVSLAEYQYLLSLKNMSEITLHLPFSSHKDIEKGNITIDLIPEDREILNDYLSNRLKQESDPCEQLLSWCHGLSIEVCA